MIRWFERHNRISWIVTFVIAGIVFYISSLTFGAGIGGGSKSILYHFSAFFFLALFLSISLTKGKQQRFIVLAIVLAIVYGISDELHQLFVPGRAGALSDVFINSVGIIFASMIYLIVFAYRRNGLREIHKVKNMGANKV